MALETALCLSISVSLLAASFAWGVLVGVGSDGGLGGSYLVTFVIGALVCVDKSFAWGGLVSDIVRRRIEVFKGEERRIYS